MKGFFDLPDTVIGRMLNEWANVLLLLAAFYLLLRLIRGGDDYAERKPGRTASASKSEFLFDALASGTAVLTAGNAMAAAMCVLFDLIGRSSPYEDKILYGHLIWLGVFSIAGSACRAASLRLRERDRSVHKLLLSIYEYLLWKTGRAKAECLMRLVGEVLGQCRDTEKLSQLLEDVEKADDAYVMIGERALHTLMDSFIKPEQGASGWFRLSEEGKTACWELDALLEQTA